MPPNPAPYGATQLREDLHLAAAMLLTLIRQMPDDIRQLGLTRKDAEDLTVIGKALTLLGQHATKETQND